MRLLLPASQPPTGVLRYPPTGATPFDRLRVRVHYLWCVDLIPNLGESDES